MAGDTPVEVGKVMITAAGRKAVERYPARMSPPPRCAISGPGPRNAPLYPALDQSVRFMFDPPHAATQSPNSRKRQSMPALAAADACASSRPSCRGNSASTTPPRFRRRSGSTPDDILSLGFNDRYDVIVALATLGAGDREVTGAGGLAFLNSERVQWMLL